MVRVGVGVRVRVRVRVRVTRAPRSTTRAARRTRRASACLTHSGCHSQRRGAPAAAAAASAWSARLSRYASPIAAAMRCGSRRPSISGTVMSFVVISCVALRANLTRLNGTIPCQPRPRLVPGNCRQPTYAAGEVSGIEANSRSCFTKAASVVPTAAASEARKIVHASASPPSTSAASSTIGHGGTKSSGGNEGAASMSSMPLTGPGVTSEQESRGSQHGRRRCKGSGVSAVTRSTVSRCRDSSAGSVRESCCCAASSAESSEAVEVGILCRERSRGGAPAAPTAAVAGSPSLREGRGREHCASPSNTK
eukprot:scaffold40844_cov48-Phaeocystis_antarctica.AAC.2